jgi:hypothetical protein
MEESDSSRESYELEKERGSRGFKGRHRVALLVWRGFNLLGRVMQSTSRLGEVDLQEGLEVSTVDKLWECTNGGSFLAPFPGSYS